MPLAGRGVNPTSAEPEPGNQKTADDYIGVGGDLLVKSPLAADTLSNLLQRIGALHVQDGIPKPRIESANNTATTCAVEARSVMNGITPDEERFIELGAKIAIIAAVIATIFLLWAWYMS